MKKTNKTINILGAFDRYNYGDLLFPILLEMYLKKYKKDIYDNYQLKFYGLVKSNLTSVGGKETQSIKELYQDNISDGSMIIVSGGEVIGSRNSNLYLDLCNNYIKYKILNTIIKISKKVKKINYIEFLLRSKFNGHSDYPWLIEQEKFTNKVLIAYNTVGGRIPKKDYLDFKNKLLDATYISVRENDTLKDINDSKVNLYPDSATIMSSFFPLDELYQLTSPKVKKFVKDNHKYISLQTNLKIYNEYKNDFINEIKKINAKSNDTKIVLLPLGYATNHDDRIALRDIKNKLPEIVELIEDVNIYDMMYIIGTSEFFAGTSLHGNITAMSYCVPHIGLSKKRPKLESYLFAWDIEEQNHCININELYEYYNKLSDLDRNILKVKRDELVELVLENNNQLFGDLH